MKCWNDGVAPPCGYWNQVQYDGIGHHMDCRASLPLLWIAGQVCNDEGPCGLPLSVD